jgi:hypothetical protein
VAATVAAEVAGVVIVVVVVVVVIVGVVVVVVIGERVGVGDLAAAVIAVHKIINCSRLLSSFNYLL